MKNKSLPLVALTMGDPAGIGPETVLKIFLNPELKNFCRALVVGDVQILSILAKKLRLNVRPIFNVEQAQFKENVVDVLEVGGPKDKIVIGKPSKAGGALSALCVQKSVELALQKKVDALVHAPISKTAWKMAGIFYPGHTEMISDLCKIKKFAMAIAAENLRTVMASRHLALKDAAQSLNKKDIIEAILIADLWLSQLKIKNPKIGVCALNPHAGENGHLGKEEIKIINPAIVQAQKKVRAQLSKTALPADSVLRDLRFGQWDCVVTMVHDQSMIPLKIVAPHKLVNITLGLPFARVSPGHGTAFDIAGKFKADSSATLEAVKVAIGLIQK